jgi:hypothetical protein
MKCSSRTWHVLALAAVAQMLMAHPVQAQGWGVRGGAAMNPDQVYVGGSYELGPIAEHVWVQPSGDLGFGNGATLLAANVDAVYRLWHQRRGPWRLDVGGGPAVNHFRFDGYSQTDTGVTLLAALVHSSGWSPEVRVGFLDSPDFRVGVSYRFANGVRGGTRKPGGRRK